MKLRFVLVFTFILLFISQTAADVKIKQRVTVEGQGSEQTRMIKGARERNETKIVVRDAGDEDVSNFMPQIARITQCDLRRTLSVNDKKKTYFIEPFPDETGNQTPTTPKPSAPTRRGGTVTISFTVTDTKERKTMFGMTARHLIVVQSMETSADSCQGAGSSKMEIDGWYVDFSADFNCPIDLPEYTPEKPDCRDRVIFKRSIGGRLGFLLDGTMKSFDSKNKVIFTSKTETLEISREPLSVSLFDVGKDYTEVSSLQSLYAMPSMEEMMGMAKGRNETVSTPKSDGKKYLGLDFFTGNSSKVNQDAIRQTMLERLNDRGFATSFVTSPNEISSGRFDYVIGVNIINVKQSKAAKIGGLFGKVTGDASAAKIGDSEAEVVVTVYQKDGKTIVAQQTAKQKIAGNSDEAVTAAIENALEKLVGKIK